MTGIERARMACVVLAPDSFKGSLTAPEVCAALARGLARAMPERRDSRRGRWPTAAKARSTRCSPRSASAAQRERRGVDAARPATPVDAAYGLVPHRDGLTAVIEIAQVVGITDPVGMRDAGRRTLDARPRRARRAPARRAACAAS